MNTDLEHQTSVNGAAAVVPAGLAEKAARDAAAAIADATPPNTVRARAAAMRAFWTWAELAHGLAESYPVPAPVLLDFINTAAEGFPADVEADMVDAGVKRAGRWSVATIGARVAHLAAAHRILGAESPTAAPIVRERLRALRVARAGGRRQHDAITRSALDQMLRTVDGGEMRQIRDRALLLFIWATGGRRRSEACAACVEDLTVDGPDYVLRIPKSKADQVGEGFDVPLAGRAAHAVRTWLLASKISAGPLFRAVDRWGNVGNRPMSGQAVYDAVKRAAAAAGLDPKRYGVQSLRAGFVAECGRQGIALQDAMLMTGHRSVAVAARYYQVRDRLNQRAARLAG